MEKNLISAKEAAELIKYKRKLTILDWIKSNYKNINQEVHSEVEFKTRRRLIRKSDFIAWCKKNLPGVSL